MTERQKLQWLRNQGKIKEAIKVAKELDRSFSKVETEVLQIAYECLSGKEGFYKQLGVDVESAKEQAKKLLNKIN